MNKALIVVDVQNDFCEGGALAVPGTDEEYLQVIDELFEESLLNGLKIFATQDWHPKGHVSFASTHNLPLFSIKRLENGDEQKLWPDHCVQNTQGAEFARNFSLGLFSDFYIIRKGQRLDSYSAFYEDNSHPSWLNAELYEGEVDTLFICGLATDYCVKATVLDALEEGFKTYLIIDGCRGVNEDDSKTAIQEMVDKGAIIIDSDDYIVMLEREN